jgi:antitoxin (DNA-binding transcriptional repressor) of toxin-antitoxin stability system
MISAGIRELKNNLSRFLRHVAAGERVLVTDRGRVVAELRPPGDEAREAAPTSRYDRLVAAGLIRPPLEQGDPLAGWPPPGWIPLPPGTAQALIDEDRDER